MTFKKDTCPHAENDWERIKDINNTIEELKKLRQDNVKREGSLLRSKIAWKIATLRQAYIWRLGELAESCAFNWNNHFYISALTLARSALETAVIICELDEDVQTGLDTQDLAFIDKCVMAKSFSTRIEGLEGSEKEFKAKNILTFIQKQNRTFEGLEFLYANLSEHVHPNQFGHRQHYGSLNHSNGQTSFSNGKYLEGKLHAIMFVFAFIDLAIIAINRLNQNIIHVADLQSPEDIS